MGVGGGLSMDVTKRRSTGDMLAKMTYELLEISNGGGLRKNEVMILKDICEDLLQLAIQTSKE